MANLFSTLKSNTINLIPILILFIIAFNGSSVINFTYITVSVHYVLVYYWVLRRPEILGYGFIFLSGIVNDVVYGLPLGVSALTLLTIASVATYIRTVTVRITLANDWISFIPALLFANLIYFLCLYFSNYSIDYMLILKNSVFTFAFYPILWAIFSLINFFMEN
jgi:rod shape-determining protein MreD